MSTKQKYYNRDSNMELLRILAMLGILVLHTDFFALGAPTKEDCANAPFISVWRLFIESLTIISVNLFVLLSGWYGIRPKKKRFVEFLFQILFFNLFFFAVFSLFIPEKTLTRDGIESIFMLDKRFWFVKAYLLLYMISPILNSYTEKAPLQQFRLILLGFFIFQTIYGWLFPSISWFNFGYSSISFIGLYLLASYLHKIGFTWGGRYHIIFIIFVLFNTIFAFGCIYFNRAFYNQRLFAYNSPFIIITSVAVFLTFTNIHFKSRLINNIAISCFAAFLFHANHFFLDEIYVKWLKEWFKSDSIYMFSMKTSIFILIIFTLSIILDKVRIWVWESLSKKYRTR